MIGKVKLKEIIKEHNIICSSKGIHIFTDSMYSKNTLVKWYPSWVKQNIVKKKINELGLEDDILLI